MATYVSVTKKRSVIRQADGTIHKLCWRKIPKDHGDPELRAARPGSFANHPTKDIVFIIREGSLDEWERQT